MPASSYPAKKEEQEHNDGPIDASIDAVFVTSMLPNHLYTTHACLTGGT